MTTYSFSVMYAGKMVIHSYVLSVFVIVESLYYIKMYSSFLPTIMSQCKTMGAII